MVEELQRWIDLADERMSEYGIDVFVMPGNDDPWSCDAVLEAASHVQACDERVVRVGDHEMISCAFANPTPWNSPRELDEDALYTKIKALADQVESPETAIFNLHVPPYDTGLDTANEINPDLTLVYKSGQPNPIPVGSTAVRQIIEEYQPLLALHGHIHESRGEARIGRTLCINSGSEYNSGRIHGVTVKLAPTRGRVTPVRDRMRTHRRTRRNIVSDMSAAGEAPPPAPASRHVRAQRHGPCPRRLAAIVADYQLHPRPSRPVTRGRVLLRVRPLPWGQLPGRAAAGDPAGTRDGVRIRPSDRR